MKNVLFYISMALAFVACINETTVQSVENSDGITITTTLAPKSAITKAVEDNGDNKITVTWATDEHMAILYEIGSTKYVSDAKIIAVDPLTGAATISFTVEGSTPDNTFCTIVYPLAAAKEDHSGVKDAATLLANQDGTLNSNLDVRVGVGRIDMTTPSLSVSTQPQPQFAIFKLSANNSDASATIDVNPLTITIGTQDYVITPASATSVFYVALPPISSQAISFTATGNGDKTYYCSKASATYDAGYFYQSVLKMGELATGHSLASSAVGEIICSDGKAYAAKDKDFLPFGVTAWAMVAYKGNDCDCTNGLAIALQDVSGSKYNWADAKTQVGTWASSYTVTGGTWRLPSLNDWQHMFIGCGSETALNPSPSSFNCEGFKSKLSTAGGTAMISSGSKVDYWSSTAKSGTYSWTYRFDKSKFDYWQPSSSYYVRACLAF